MAGVQPLGSGELDDAGRSPLRMNVNVGLAQFIWRRAKNCRSKLTVWKVAGAIAAELTNLAPLLR